MDIFCSIIKKEIPSELLYEDVEMIAINDIHPKAPVHVLIIPKNHIASVNVIEEKDTALISRMIYRAKLLAKELGISESGYKLVLNTGPDSGQGVAHLHLHLLGGKNLNGVT